METICVYEAFKRKPVPNNAIKWNETRWRKIVVKCLFAAFIKREVGVLLTFTNYFLPKKNSLCLGNDKYVATVPLLFTHMLFFFFRTVGTRTIAKTKVFLIGAT